VRAVALRFDVPLEPISYPRGESLFADLIIKRLNDMIADPEVRRDLDALFRQRIPVSPKTLEHTTIQCDGETGSLAVLGLLNGLCGLIGGTGPRAQWGFIAAEMDDSTGELIRFVRTPEE
jgi:hypothetical protein